MEEGTKFNANIHIEKPVVLLAPSKKYFTLTDVSYEQTISKQKKDGKKSDKPKEKNESPGGGGVGI